MRNTVVIDCFPASASRYPADYAIVAIDVVRATTTAITAAAAGRRCFPIPTLGAARALANKMIGNPLLVGEQKGFLPAGFDLNNSPSELLARDDIDRPVILLSSTGTGLCYEASKRHNSVSDRLAAVMGGPGREFKVLDRRRTTSADFTVPFFWCNAVLVAPQARKTI